MAWIGDQQEYPQRRPLSATVVGLVAGLLAMAAAPLSAQPQTTAWGCPDGFAPTVIDFTFNAANPLSTQLPQGTEVGFDDDTAAPSWTCPNANGECIFQPSTQTYSQGCNLNRPNGGEATCTQPWADVGVYLHYDLIEQDRGALDDNPGSDDSRGPLMLLDTASTANGDSDLRSPHGGHGTSAGCPSGSPGVGEAQAGPGRFYANCPADIPDDPPGDPTDDLDDPDDQLNEPLRNVVVISTNGNSGSPNDDADGGVMILLFPDFATTILRVSTLDVDGTESRPQLRLFSDLWGGDLIAPVNGCDPDDNDGNAGTLYDNADSELELGDVDCTSNVNPTTNTEHVDADDDSVPSNATASTDDDAATLGNNTLIVQTDVNLQFPQVDPSITADGGQLVRRVEYELLGSGSLDELVYCRRETFTPVAVVHFAASPAAPGVRFEWSTATEIGTAGFYLDEKTPRGWSRLNRAPVPSRTVESTVPQHYVFEAPAATGTEFRLVEVSTRGVQTIRAAAELGGAVGAAPDAEPVAWPAIGAEHRAKAASRRAGEPARVGGFPAAAVRLDADGLYRITYDQLLAAGVDLTGAPADRLALSAHQDHGPLPGGRVAVPIRVETSGSPTFGPGGFIEFIGEGRDSLYTDTNVYRLTVDPALAARAAADPSGVPRAGAGPASYRETRIVDDDRAYSPGSATGDPWYDLRLIAVGDPASAAVELEVDHLLPGAADAVLQLSLYGVSNLPATDPDHHLLVDLNGLRVADATFDGPDALDLEVPLPAAALVEGTNTVRLTLPFDNGVVADIVDLDTYGVSYSRRPVARNGRLRFSGSGPVFEVAGLDGASAVEVWARRGARQVYLENVELAAGTARFAGASRSEMEYMVYAREAIGTPEISPWLGGGDDLLTGDADLLVLAHADFIGPAPPGLLGLDDLVAARRRGADPLSVKVVDVAQVYDRYSGGIFDPDAIRAYLREARPALGVDYVLLVGGDTYDYRDHLGLGSISFIPTPYVETGDQFPVRFTPSDPFYADLDDDRVPDLAIGRLPVRTSAELDAVIRKTLLYGTAPHQGRSLLVADRVDGAVSFRSLSESLGDRLPAGWTAATAYVDELGVDGARTAAVDAINQGVAVTNYFGHSGPGVWGTGLLSSSQVEDLLDNEGLPTVVTQWGCWNTYYVEPRLDTMAHKLLLNPLEPNRGAAAVLGATTLTEVFSDIALGPEVFTRMLTAGTRLGDAVQEAKRAVATSGRAKFDDVILGWTLLGDPTLEVVE